MTKMDKEVFAERIKGMSPEELEQIVELIPVEMCMVKITKELDRLQAFENSIKSIVR